MSIRSYLARRTSYRTAVTIAALWMLLSPKLSRADFYVTVTGTVFNIEVEGGCWVLVGDNGYTYELYGGDANLYQEGIRAAVSDYIRSNMVSICMLGYILDVDSYQIHNQNGIHHYYYVDAYINNISNTLDADADGYYEQFDFDILINIYVEPYDYTSIWSVTIQSSTGQSWPAEPLFCVWCEQVRPFGRHFDEADFAGFINGNSDVDFSIRGTLLYYDMLLQFSVPDVRGEPFKMEPSVTPDDCMVDPDANDDGGVDDFELLDYIDRWALAEVDDFNLLDAVDWWATGLRPNRWSTCI